MASTKKAPTPRSAQLLAKGINTTDEYMDVCSALINDIAAGRVAKREAARIIREANKWLAAWGKKVGW